MKKYTPAYFNALYEIEKECFADCWNENTMLNELSLSQAHYFLAEADGVVAGYIGFWLICGEAEIMKVAVKKDKRNNGIGDALLKIAIEEAKKLGAESVLLEVRENNVSARHLYEKNGFLAYGKREKYYEGIEDAVLYKKTL